MYSSLITSKNSYFPFSDPETATDLKTAEITTEITTVKQTSEMITTEMTPARNDMFGKGINCLFLSGN